MGSLLIWISFGHLDLNKFLIVRFLSFFILICFISRTNGQSFEVYADKSRVEVYEQNDIPLNLGLSAYKFVRIPYKGSSIDINIKVKDLAYIVKNEIPDTIPHARTRPDAKRGQNSAGKQWMRDVKVTNKGAILDA